MEIVYFLVPASLLLAAIGLGGYLWAVRSGQFDDLETPRWKMLADEAAVRNSQCTKEGMKHD